MRRWVVATLLATTLPACAEPPLAAGDLNHRRWTATAEGGGQLSLAFGERLFFEFVDGCRSVHGFARIERGRLVFEAQDGSGQPCDANRGPLNPDSLLAAPWQVTLPADGSLNLRQGELHTTLQRDDWR